MANRRAKKQEKAEALRLYQEVGTSEASRRNA
jgi:hypothetical protein